MVEDGLILEILLHRVQKSDAGVGIGTLIGDREYLAQNWGH